MVRWRCSECGCSREAAERKRKRLGLPVLIAWAKTCSPPCARAREKRFLREKYGSGTSYHQRVRRKLESQKRARRGAWRCVECGCSLEKAPGEAPPPS
jgi:hypothetical protein